MIFLGMKATLRISEAVSSIFQHFLAFSSIFQHFLAFSSIFQHFSAFFQHFSAMGYSIASVWKLDHPLLALLLKLSLNQT
jgi:hypothetical protein